jgi:hypothetical protein
LDIVGANDYPHLRVAAAPEAPFGAFLSLDASALADGNQYFIFATGALAGEGAGKLVFKNQSSGQVPLCFDAGGNVGVKNLNPEAALHVNGEIKATAFNTTSDRNAKSGFAPVDSREVLERVAGLPISQWHFKEDDSKARHIGPVAQDFHAAFGTGRDDKHITSVDADGVALAAIQGLYQVVKERDAEIEELKAQVQDLVRLIRQAQLPRDDQESGKKSAR